MYDDRVWFFLKDGKIPADLLLLKSTDANGICGTINYRYIKFALSLILLLCLKMIIVLSYCSPH